LTTAEGFIRRNRFEPTKKIRTILTKTRPVNVLEDLSVQEKWYGQFGQNLDACGDRQRGGTGGASPFYECLVAEAGSKRH
jgi:hypothetical protein